MPKDLFDKIEQTITTTGKAAAKKAREVADTAKIKNDIRVAKRELNDLYEQVGGSILSLIWIIRKRNILICLI